MTFKPENHFSQEIMGKLKRETFPNFFFLQRKWATASQFLPTFHETPLPSTKTIFYLSGGDEKSFVPVTRPPLTQFCRTLFFPSAFFSPKENRSVANFLNN